MSEHAETGSGAPDPLTRRGVLRGAGAVGLTGLLGACDSGTSAPQRVAPTGAAVHKAAERRARAGAATRDYRLRAAPQQIDLGGPVVHTWSYGDTLPGPLLRGNPGERMRIEVTNALTQPTTVHWHGLAIRNDMDGVPHLTQDPIAPGHALRYEFTLPRPGTYLYHSHQGVQRARGLYGPLVIDDPAAPGDHDVEFILVLDDWTDGLTATPEQVLAALRKTRHYRVPVQAGALHSGPALPPPRPSSTAPGGQPMMGMPSGPGGDIQPPLHLINGRSPNAPATLSGKPGQRALIRVINASASSVYRIALGGHRLTVTATDAYPVEPIEVDTLRIHSGERYDLTTTLADGVFPFCAVAEGRRAQALALIRTGAGSPPPASVQPNELDGKLLALTDLVADQQVRLPDRRPDTTHDLWLDGDMMDYTWQIDGHAYQARTPFTGITPIPIHNGNRLRVRILNQTPMYHPIHVHGHTFQIRATGTIGGRDTPLRAGTRKDTVSVAPMQTITIDLAADNPGQWLTHCHNAYHLASGMATVLSYLS